jgi:hypothetical protein
MLGNPPFVGNSYQTIQQKNDLERVFAGIKSSKMLDYVAAWYWKAAQYIQGTRIKVAFVSTNSITQGEQVRHSLATHAFALRYPYSLCPSHLQMDN